MIDALRNGIERGHADAGGKVHRCLAAGLNADARHFVEDAAGAAVDIKGIIFDAEVFHDAVGVVDIGLHAVRHQHADHVFTAISLNTQRGDDGAVLAAGDADHGRFTAAAVHLPAHPVQKPRNVFSGLKILEIVHNLRSFAEILLPL